MFSEPPSKDAFLSGKIVNPLSQEIIISRDSHPIDTVYLDSTNRFQVYFKDVEPGLISFTHDKENQNVFLEPGDSIIIYANTINFDESLNFSGRGAEKNNFLMQLYLINEFNNSLILTYYTIEPEEFLKKTDSLKEDKVEKLQRLDNKYNFSEAFTEIAKTSIDYEYYDLKERYSFLINKYNPEVAKNYPSNFHDYRKKIDFNDKSLQNHYGYLRFLDNFLKNKSTENCPDNDQSCFDLYSYENLKQRLVLIDSITKNQELKNSFFLRVGSKAIISANTPEDISNILKLLESENLPDSELKSLKILAAVQNVYIPEKPVPPVKLTTPKAQKVLMSSIIKKPTIFYNWSVDAPEHYLKQHKIIAELREKFPEIDFIGLNLDFGETMSWKEVLKNQQFPEDKEYQIQEIPMDKEYLLFFINKILFVDASGKVITGNLKLHTPDFEVRLNEYLNKISESSLAIK